MRNFRKPLIVLTPKKYLRFEGCTIDELSRGEFRHLIDDASLADAAARQVTRVVYCTGKIYHELAERRAAGGVTGVALVRVEQLYPFHTSAAKAIDGRFPRTAARVWAQEEPRNAGAYTYIADVFRTEMGIELSYVGRPASASPATASEHTHKDQQDRLLAQALGAPAPAAHEESHAVNGRGGVTPGPRQTAKAGKH